jgi:hypothetical protein
VRRGRDANQASISSSNHATELGPSWKGAGKRLARTSRHNWIRLFFTRRAALSHPRTTLRESEARSVSILDKVNLTDFALNGVRFAIRRVSTVRRSSKLICLNRRHDFPKIMTCADFRCDDLSARGPSGAPAFFHSLGAP